MASFLLKDHFFFFFFFLFFHLQLIHIQLVLCTVSTCPLAFPKQFAALVKSGSPGEWNRFNVVHLFFLGCV